MSRQDLIDENGGTPESAAKAVAAGKTKSPIKSGDWEVWGTQFQTLVLSYLISNGKIPVVE